MTVRCKSSSGQAGNLAYWNGSDWISSPSYDAVFWVGVVRGKSQYLLATNFNFSIPTTASAITCFKITVEGKSSVITPKTTVFASVRMQRDAGV